MLLVDPRKGSGDLAEPLRRKGLEVEVTKLDAGDVAFEGTRAGKPVSVGIELKALQDCVNSLRTGRLAGHQLLKLLPTYDERWLLVEGELRWDRQGMLQGWRGSIPGRMTVSELMKKLLTLHYRGGLHVWMTSNRKDTLTFIQSLYRWWTDGDFESHRSHLAFHQEVDPRLFAKESVVKEMAFKIPGLGWAKAGEAAKHFKTPALMTSATVEQWMQIAGVGKVLARQAVKTCQEAQ